jgi:hypothetical protein
MKSLWVYGGWDTAQNKMATYTELGKIFTHEIFEK